MTKNIFYNDFYNFGSFDVGHVLSDAETLLVGGAGPAGDAISTIANGMAIGAGFGAVFGPEMIPVGAVMGAGIGAAAAYMDSSQMTT